MDMKLSKDGVLILKKPHKNGENSKHDPAEFYSTALPHVKEDVVG